MKKVKSASVSGSFYPDNKEELIKLISNLEYVRKSAKNFTTRAVIVPHAGLIYSGALAKKGVSHLDKNIKNVFIFAPAHKVYFEGLSIPDYEFFETPLGEIPLNRAVLDDLNKNFGAKFYNEAFVGEHSIEIQLPFIQTYLKDVNIIPVLLGSINPDTVAKIIENYYDNKDFGFIISSDLSHFYTDKEARAIDLTTAQMIEKLNTANFLHSRACGAIGIIGLMKFVSARNFSLLRLGMSNSSDVTGEKKRVVGYGAWALYEKGKNEYIKEYYSDFLIDFCHKAIENHNLEINADPVFEEEGASFVTLEENKSLRGCIGSIIAHRSLIQDIFHNAKSAAFSDPRFAPVSPDEFSKIKVSISLLSEPIGFAFESEEDLLNKLRKDIDGLIIQDMGKRAVFLPSVWEQLPDKKEFLKALKIKAGMPPEHFSKSFCAYRFTTDYIKEN